jgi:putative membrane protein
MTEQRLREGLAVGYGALWLALAVAPLHRGDWALENLLVVAFVAILWRTGAWLSLSRASFLCILVFLCLHAVGAHYTYSLVPYDRWAEALTGSTLNGMLGFERNHYDRLVHLAYGLLLTAPIREILPPTDRIGTAWRLFLPVAVVLSLSAAYEILEWAAAAVLGGEIGIAYVGAQGDVWDAEKDMALAAAGALFASAVAAVSERPRA